MLDYRRLLADARLLKERAESFDKAFGEVVAELRAPRRRRHPPVEYVRPRDGLAPLREAALRLDAELGSNLGLPLVRALMLECFPRVFEMNDGQPHVDGRRLVRVATAGAWSHGEGAITAVLELSVAVASARVTATEILAADIWARIMSTGASAPQDRFDLAQRLSRVALNLARPAAVDIEADPHRPGRVLWIGRPSDRLRTPPADWTRRVEAVSRSLGMLITVVDYPVARAADITRWVTSRDIDILVTWAPQPSPSITQIVTAYESSNSYGRVIVLNQVNFQDAIQYFWIEADEIIETWTPPPPQAAHRIPDDRVAYLQKKGTAGDHDLFDVRAACPHRNFSAVHHADKGLKGVERMFGAAPTRIFKCAQAGCSCWMAAFD